MDFRILGPLEVWHHGRYVQVTAPMQRAVLAALLMRPGAVVSIESIIDQLWGPVAPPTAQVTVRNYVQRLRRVLPEPVLETVPPGYRLRIEPDQVDVHRFERLVDAARASTAAEPLRAEAQFAEALGLWRGAPLGNIGEVPMRLSQVPRLEELCLGAVEDRYEVWLRLGWHARLVADLVPMINAYPLRERLCKQLMIALYRRRRPAEALAHFRQLRRRLVDELGVEPGAELRRLERSILCEDLTQSVPYVPVP